MPLVAPPSTPKLTSRVADLVRQRRQKVRDMLQLYEDHEAILSQYDELKAEISDLDGDIKIHVRSLFETGARRGPHTVVDSADLSIIATVKYGAESADPEALEEALDELNVQLPGLIAITKEVNVKLLRAAIRDRLLPRNLASLISPGDFKTTSIAIKDTINTSIVDGDV